MLPVFTFSHCLSQCATAGLVFRILGAVQFCYFWFRPHSFLLHAMGGEDIAFSSSTVTLRVLSGNNAVVRYGAKENSRCSRHHRGFDIGESCL